jgi:threonyl-tRNA synthetase
MAMKEHFPHAKPTIGPVTEHGFYYDFDFAGGPKVTPEDFPKLEKNNEGYPYKKSRLRSRRGIYSKSSRAFCF